MNTFTATIQQVEQYFTEIVLIAFHSSPSIPAILSPLAKVSSSLAETSLIPLSLSLDAVVERTSQQDRDDLLPGHGSHGLLQQHG